MSHSSNIISWCRNIKACLKLRLSSRQPELQTQTENCPHVPLWGSIILHCPRGRSRPTALQHWQPVVSSVPPLLVGLSWWRVHPAPDPPACCWPPTACEPPPRPEPGGPVPFPSSHHNTSLWHPPCPQTQPGRWQAGLPALGSSPTWRKRDLWGVGRKHRFRVWTENHSCCFNKKHALYKINFLSCISPSTNKIMLFVRCLTKTNHACI